MRGLKALQERDSHLERWLPEEVAPVTAAMEADPGRAIPADRVFGEIRKLHAGAAKRSANKA